MTSLQPNHAVDPTAVGADGTRWTDPDPGYPARLLRTVIGAIIVFSSSMTIVSASLPTMADDLGSTEAFLSWGVTGMFLSMGVGTPVLGRLGDVHGHRTVFIAGAMTLSVGTILCAIAPSALGFVVARMIVGLGIAATMPNGMALIMEQYPPADRPRAMGWFQMAMTGAPVVGLVLGGPLIEALGWRSLFFVLTPISFAGLWASIRVIRPSMPGERVPIDWNGAAALAVATLSFLLFLERGGRAGFDDGLALGLAALAVVGFVGFIAIERRAANPMVPLSYFRRPNFRGPLLAQPLSSFAYMGSFVIAPLLLDEQLGYSINAISLVLLMRPATFSVCSPIGGRLATVVGERSMIIAGSILITGSMLLWIPAAKTLNLGLILAALGLAGIAMGLSSPSFATVLASSVDENDLGVANGMGVTITNIGTLTGIQAMFTTLGDERTTDAFARVFVLGAVVAAFGLVGALMVRNEPSDA